MDISTLATVIPNSPRVYVSNDGPHPASRLAQITAELLTDADPAISDDRKLEADRLCQSAIQALTAHHADYQHETRIRLASGLEPIEPELDGTLIDSALASFLEAATASPWAEHYAQPDVQAIAKEILAECFRMSQRIERDWHRSNQPETR